MLHFDLGSTAEMLTEFIKNAFTDAHVLDAIIGLSGGIDSSTSCVLAARALGADHVFPLLLPYGNDGKSSADDAVAVIRSLNIPDTHVVRINIQPYVDSVVAYDQTMDNIRHGNIMARMRMIFLFDFAKRQNGMVVGTENKTEYLLGYYTRYGDEASDMEPLRNLYKTQIFELAAYLGIQKNIIERTPSADLWPGQTDEKELGFTYQEADTILFLLVEKKKKEEELIHAGFSRAIVHAVIHRIVKNAFKQNVPFLPY